MGVWFVLDHEGLGGSVLSECPMLGTVSLKAVAYQDDDLGQACTFFFYFSHPNPLHPTPYNKCSLSLSHQTPV